MLLAVRCGELVVPQLARQFAHARSDDGWAARRSTSSPPTCPASSSTASRATGGRPRSCTRSASCSTASRSTSTATSSTCTLDPPRVRTGQRSQSAVLLRRSVAGGPRVCRRRRRRVPDVARHHRQGARRSRTTWTPGPRRRAVRSRYGWRSHVIVRETEDEARAAADAAVVEARRRDRRRDPQAGRSTPASAGVARQAALREGADEEGYVERHLWTGVGRARSGAGAAIVGDPDQVLAQDRRARPTPGSRRSSCRATRTPPSAICSPATCCPTSTTAGWSSNPTRSTSPDRPTCAPRANALCPAAPRAGLDGCARPGRARRHRHRGDVARRPSSSVSPLVVGVVLGAIVANVVPVLRR